MSDSPRSFDLASRVIAADFDAEVRAWLQRGFSTWANADAVISLNVALRLPNSPQGYSRVQRDLHLRIAAEILLGERVGASPAMLLHELKLFTTRGGWRDMRELRDPPGDTSALRRALFYVARATGGRTPSLKTITRAVGQIFRQHCPHH